MEADPLVFGRGADNLIFQNIKPPIPGQYVLMDISTSGVPCKVTIALQFARKMHCSGKKKRAKSLVQPPTFAIPQAASNPTKVETNDTSRQARLILNCPKSQNRFILMLCTEQMDADEHHILREVEDHY